MFRFVATSLSLALICLAPLTAVAAGPFQKLAVQKSSVQKTPMAVVQKAPMPVAQKVPVAQKAPMAVVQKVPMAVVQKAPMAVVQKAPMPVAQKGPMIVAQKSMAVCAPNVRYVQRRPCKKTCCTCTPAVQTMIQVQDPRACASCPVLVPVCLPGCCVGSPQVTSMVGLLGRGNVCLKWCCGYRVKVVFDNHGDLIVNYYGS